MSDTDARVEATRWLRYAREDLEAAQAMLGLPHIANRHVCWLAQQAAEKAIKAALVFLQVDFPRRHDLDALRTLLPDDWRVRATPPSLATLTQWAVEARYPGEWPEATSKDAETALQSADTVVSQAARDLRDHAVKAAGPDNGS